MLIEDANQYLHDKLNSPEKFTLFSNGTGLPPGNYHLQISIAKKQDGTQDHEVCEYNIVKITFRVDVYM